MVLCGGVFIHSTFFLIIRRVFMICGNCGKEIPEGLDYCEECGAPAYEPIVITDVSTKKKVNNNFAGNDGAFFNMKNYVSALTVESYRIMALVAGIMMYLSPFVFWLWEVTGSERKKANLFNIAAKNGSFHVDSTKLGLLGIAMMISGIGMIIYSARNYIRPIVPIANKKIIWVIIELIGLVSFLVVYGDDKFKIILDKLKNDIAIAKNHGSYVVAKWGYGPGFFFPIIAVILFFLALCMGIFNTSEVDRQAGL